MEIVYSEPQLDEYVKRALDNAADGGRAGTLPPLIIDRILDDAIEIDVDALFDGTELFLGGVISTGALIAGLVANSGVGLLVLFRVNKDMRANFLITLTVFASGAVVGVIFDLLGIVL
jgi:hypothetical protein